MGGNQEHNPRVGRWFFSGVRTVNELHGHLELYEVVSLLAQKRTGIARPYQDAGPVGRKVREHLNVSGEDDLRSERRDQEIERQGRLAEHRANEPAMRLIMGLLDKVKEIILDLNPAEKQQREEFESKKDETRRTVEVIDARIGAMVKEYQGRWER